MSTSAEELGKALRERERAFVRQLLYSKDQTTAAIMSGYSEKSATSQASRLLRKPEVRAYRDALLREQFEQLGITRHSIAAQVWEVYRRCMEKTPVLEWDKDERAWIESGAWQFNASGAIKALSLLSDMLTRLDGDGGDGENEDGGQSIEEMLARVSD